MKATPNHAGLFTWDKQEATPKPKTPRGKQAEVATPLSKMASLTPLAHGAKRPKRAHDNVLSAQIIHWPLPKGVQPPPEPEHEPPSTRGLLAYFTFLLMALPALFVLVLACILGGVPGFPASVVRPNTTPIGC
jgi:hypothetical protein